MSEKHFLGGRYDDVLGRAAQEGEGESVGAPQVGGRDPGTDNAGEASPSAARPALCTDPTPSALSVEEIARVIAEWVYRTDALVIVREPTGESLAEAIHSAQRSKTPKADSSDTP